MLAFNRTQLQTAMIEWVPTLGARQPREGVGAAYNAYQKREYELALRLAHPLAEQSDARAQSLLGLIYHFGRGVERNESEALKWFRRAAEQGDAVGQLELGAMYFEGRGVPQSYSEAARWFQLAADQGNPEAQYDLGVLYATGKGVPQDNVLAYLWFNLAAAHSTVPAETNRAVTDRDVVATRMSPDEIAKAQELAGGWKPK